MTPTALFSLAPRRVAASITAVQLLAPNGKRRGAIIANDPTSANLYLKYGPGATLTDFTHYLTAGDQMVMSVLEHGIYVGQITGIWAAPTGAAQVTELVEAGAP